MSNSLPQGWTHECLGPHLEILSGFAFKSQFFDTESQNGIPLIRIRDIQAQRPATFFCGEFNDTYLIRCGDIIIGMDGDFLIAKWQGPEALLNQRVCKINTSNGALDVNFIQYRLEPELIKLNRIISGTTVKHLSVKDIKQIRTFIPPLPEQEKIATILNSVDEAISATQAVIDQARKVKEGLLQDLLSRGIGHKSFKETEIGEIPEGWEIRKLGELFNLVERPVKMDDNETYNLVTVKRRQEGIVLRGQLKGAKILVKAQFKLEAGDFLISKRQIVHGACEVVPPELDGAIVSNEYHVLHPTEELDLDYFRWTTRTFRMMRYFMISSIGVHIEKMLFKLKDWYKLPVALPPLEEQKRIAKIFNSIETQIEVEEAKLAQLQQTKRGLMQDLLSGDVRVAV